MPEPSADSYPASYYAATCNRQERYPPLSASIDADVCIIGGGFTGVSAALTLAERGYQVVVLEQNRIGWGASGRNGGQVIGGIAGEEKMVRRLRPALGAEVADAVWNIGWRGNDIIREWARKYAIDCDLQWGYMDLALKPRHLKAQRTYWEELQRRGFGDAARLVAARDMPAVIGSDAYIGGLINQRSGHLHPLNLCRGEAAAAAKLGARIFEGTQAVDVQGGARARVKTLSGTDGGGRGGRGRGGRDGEGDGRSGGAHGGEVHGEVRADAVLLAGNAYLRLEARRLGGLLFPAGSFIIATEPLSAAERDAINPLNMAFCDPNYVLDYFRLSADGRMLFGGRCNYSGREPKSIRAAIQPRMLKIFPQLRGKRIDYEWGGQIAIVLNRIPLIGRLEDNLYYAMGYSGHGVNASHAAGEIIADAIGGTLEKLDLFERINHARIPFGRAFGNQLIALGMLYFRLRDLL